MRLVKEIIGLPRLRGPILDMDFARTGRWVGVIEEKGKVELVMAESDSGVVSSLEVPIPCRYPIVRWVDTNTVIVASRRVLRSEPHNACLVSIPEHRVLRTGFLEDGISDIVVTLGYLAVTYTDEGIAGIKTYGAEGVFVFDLDLRPLWGYKSYFQTSAVDIDDCYCAGVDGKGRLCFIPYPGFPLVAVDLSSRTQEVLRLPRDPTFPQAMTFVDRYCLLHEGPRTYAIIAWNVSTDSVVSLGTHCGPLRGLATGGFIGLSGDSWFTLRAHCEDARWKA